MSYRTDASNRPWRANLAIAALFLLFAIAWTWPLAPNLSARVPHDPGDPLLNAWILWWNTQAVPFTARWWSPPIFYPMPGAFALSEHLFGIALFTTPMQWAGLNALAAYNAALILSFALSGFFAFLLGRRLTGSTLAGLCAGLAFGFAPYRASHLSHLQVLTSQWMPLALLAMHAYLEDARPRWLALFAAAWLIQALSNGYYLLFFPVLVALWLAWFVNWHAPRRGLAIAATWGVSSLLLLPTLLHYRAVQQGLGLSRTTGEMMRFSARPDSFLHAPGLLKFWPSLPGETQEEFLFPGVTTIAAVLVAVILAAARRRRARGARSPLVFYAGAAILLYAFALGPAPDGSWLALAHPYTVLTHLPGFSGLRAPARFAMLAVLCLSIATALAVDRLPHSRRTLRWLLSLAVLLGLSIDGWQEPMPLAPPPGRVIYPAVAGAALVELPLEEGIVSTAAMYRSMSHDMPLINGYSGYTPPHYEILSIAMKRGDPSALQELARGRPLVVAVNDRYDPNGAYARMLESMPGVERQGSSSAGSLFVMSASAPIRQAPAGDAFPASTTELDREHAVLDLGAPQTVRSIGFALRWHYPELAERLAIEASLDSVTWTTVWEQWTGGPALAGALENALENPVRITLPDVRARYLRVHPAPKWLARELRVYGPR